MSDDPKNPGAPQDQPADTPPADSKPEGKFTQDDVDRIVSERLAREKRKSDDAAEAARVEARANALKDQEKYKELSETQATTIAEKDQRISELEGLKGERDSWKEKYEALETRFGKMMEDRLAVVAEPYKPLLERMSVEERADWLEANAEKIGLPREPSGSPASPKPAGSGAREEQRDREAKEEFQQTARSSF